MLGPELPAHPAQVYEALGDAVVIVGLLIAAWFGPFRAGRGRRFLLVLGRLGDRALRGRLLPGAMLRSWARCGWSSSSTWACSIAALAGLVASRRSPATIEPATPSSPLPAAPAGAPVWPGSREDAS